MKKTWQWVVEYKREMGDSKYLNTMIEKVRELSPEEKKMAMSSDSMTRHYDTYINWTIISKHRTGRHRGKGSIDGWISPDGPMKPAHLNTCMFIIVNMMQPGSYPYLADEGINLRLRNVKTGEIIPGELFCE